MARNDTSEGPRVGQVVLYNNAGTTISAIIYAVNTDGTVSLNSFDASGATNRASIGYDANLGTSKWRYMEFF